MKKIYLLTSFALFCAAGCQRGIYIPDKVHSPGFTQAGEAKLDISLKPQRSDSNGSLVSFSSDLAYAPINHLGLIASFRSVNNKTIADNRFMNNDSRFSRLNGSRVDLGAGYFGTMGKRGKFEIYAGYGMGNIRNSGSVDTGITGHTDVSYKAHYSRLFVQPGIGFQTRVFSLMGGMRFTYQKYRDIESPNSEVRYSLVPQRSLDITSPVFTFIEPYIEMQAGGKWVKFNYQLGWACQAGGPSLRYAAGLPYMTFGILFHFAPSYLKKAAKKEL